MTSMGSAALLLLSSIACFQYLPTSCQALKINSNREGKPSVAGFVIPVLRGKRTILRQPTTFDFAPIDKSVPVPSPLSADNAIPSTQFRWRRNKIQMHAKKLKRSISDVQIEEKFGQDNIILLNGVDVNGSVNDVDSNDTSPIISNTNGEVYNDEEVDYEIENKHDMEMMQIAIGMAASTGGERGSHGPFPRPVCGAVLVAKDGRVSLFLL